MKHSVDELLDVVYRYYPRNVDRQDPRYEQTEEYQRLSAARRRAGAQKETWYTMLERTRQQFPSDTVQNDSLHLPTGQYDACYSGKVFLTPKDGEEPRTIGFLVSFVVPCYSLYSSHFVNDEPDPEYEARAAQFPVVIIGDTCYCVPVDHPLTRLVEPVPVRQRRRRILSLDFLPAEQPYATWLAREIEETWGSERMPPEVGRVVVPDVATNNRLGGEATLYDCLLSDHW